MPSTIYDEFPYESHPYEETHPDRMATIGTLYGLTPPAPSTARVLELGCGSAANVVAIAYAYPDVRAVGIDLAETAIEEARQLASDVGVTNAEFHVADLLELQEGELGEFDYVISHGVYAWVPPPIREAVLVVSRSHLSEHGLAYISFNTQPGGHFRRAMRDIGLWWGRDAGNARQRAEKARELFEELFHMRSGDDPYGSLFGKELDALRKSTTYLIHDILSDEWDPVWLYDFVEAAAKHGLKFVSESRFEKLREGHWPEGIEERLEALAGGDKLVRTQLADVLSFERFRATLSCHEWLEPLDRPDLSKIADMRLRVQLPPRDQDTELCKRMMALVVQRVPDPVPFTEVLSLVGGDRDELIKEVYDAAFRGQIALHVDPPEIGSPHAERPKVSTFARRQAVHGGVTGTLFSRSIGVTGDTEKRVLTLLDGTRTRDEVIRDLGADGGPEITPEGLDSILVDLAGVGLLAP